MTWTYEDTRRKLTDVYRACNGLGIIEISVSQAFFDAYASGLVMATREVPEGAEVKVPDRPILAFKTARIVIGPEYHPFRVTVRDAI